jgi:REP element-mobilizing transposase RayT
MKVEHKGWYSRGYLPHFDACEVIQSINFRLFDSLPEKALMKLKDECIGNIDLEKHETLEKFLDSGCGCCFLRDPSIAQIVENSLLFFDGKRYRLSAWVIMPNHVHVMINMIEGFRLPDIVKSWKAFSAREANKVLGREGEFWQRDYFDRYIRDETHYNNLINYIQNNPVEAGFVEKPEDWPFGSARFLKD